MGTMQIKLFFLTLISTFLFSNEIKPAMLFDADIIFDNTWNETIYNGIKNFEKKPIFLLQFSMR